MIEYDEEWFSYYEGVLKDKPEYKVGHVLRPVDNLCGYSIIASTVSNKIVGKCYIIITDFGNKLRLTEGELDQSFTVIGWQGVLERAKEQQERLESAYYDVFGVSLEDIQV